MLLFAIANVFALFGGISEVWARTVPLCVCCGCWFDVVMEVGPPVLAMGVFAEVVIVVDVDLPDKK